MIILDVKTQAEDMGLEPKLSLASCCLVLFIVVGKVLEFQGFQRVGVEMTDLQDM